MMAGHGPNIGHGYVKYVIIGPDGVEKEPVIFPAMIGRAERAVAGALGRVAAVEVGGARYWTGDDAQFAPSPLTMLAQDRLQDTTFIPALLRGALARFGALNGSTTGACVTGLPATWAQDVDKARLLGERLRAATPYYAKIKVIPEPLGLVYSALLNNNGQIAGDPALQTGQVAVVDLGHLTVDIAVVKRLTPLGHALDTYQLGSVQPLKQIRSRLSDYFERELTIYETDLAVRSGALRVAGTARTLPARWDAPLIENGQAIAARLVEAWGKGTQFDAILIGGGGAEVPSLVAAIQRKFAHAVPVEAPQTAIARGYARLARRLGAS